MAAPTGVAIAFTNAALSATPTWSRIDNVTGLYVTGWTVDRGRSYELDRIDSGTATITVIDTLGKLDPTNSSGPNYGYIDPLRQAAICLWNPVASSWSTIFQGFVEDWEYDVDPSEKYATVTIRLVDMLDILAATEVVPGSYGTTVPAGSEGNVYYAATSNVHDRIVAALADASIPSAFHTASWGETIFSGNVEVQETVYPPRSTILQVIQDACDAEWPGVANFFVSKDGLLMFRGRESRFNPTDASYHISAWKCGDLTAVAADSTKATLSGLTFERGLSKIINAALATPQGIADADIAGQLATNAGSITTYGVRSWSAENLLTLQGLEVGTPAANAETKKFATYYEANYGAPQNRIAQAKFRSQQTTVSNATNHWAFLCGVDIEDTLTVTSSNPGGGGFTAEPCFVEGVHYECKPMRDTMAEVTLTVDLSPQAYFTTDPF